MVTGILGGGRSKLSCLTWRRVFFWRERRRVNWQFFVFALFFFRKKSSRFARFFGVSYFFVMKKKAIKTPSSPEFVFSASSLGRFVTGDFSWIFPPFPQIPFPRLPQTCQVCHRLAHMVGNPTGWVPSIDAKKILPTCISSTSEARPPQPMVGKAMLVSLVGWVVMGIIREVSPMPGFLLERPAPKGYEAHHCPLIIP